ncbi:hypothetical protein HELRODRAFT_184458, partial [Helobdella robusta]|uniref:Uncharacterized protein n=1 Tax=Helobdella robusta TaxID=6412 RepID=T1FL88_HELRO
MHVTTYIFVVFRVQPDGTHLRDYGRLRKDGEMKMRRHTEKRDRNLWVMGETYNYKDALVLSQFYLDENNSALPKDKEKMSFALVDKKTKEPCIFTSKTQEIGNTWPIRSGLFSDSTPDLISLTNNNNFNNNNESWGHFDEPVRPFPGTNSTTNSANNNNNSDNAKSTDKEPCPALNDYDWW